MKINNIKTLFVLNIFLIFLIFLEFMYFYVVENSYDLFFRKILDFQFLFVLFFSLVSGISSGFFFHPYNIFLGTFFIFLGGRFFLDLFNLKDVMLMDRFISFFLLGREQLELYEIMIFCILYINLGFLTSNFLLKQNNEFKINKKDLQLRKIYIFLYEIFCSLELYKKFILFIFVLKNSYLDIYRLKIDYPFFTKGSGTFLEGTFILFLLTKPTKKQFITISFQYLFLGFLEALSGSRGRLIVRFLVVLTYYFCEYKKKVNYLFLIGISTFLIFFSQIIAQIRTKMTINLKDVFISFVSQQGTSINVLGTIIKFKEELKEIIKFSIVPRLTENGNSIINAKSGELAHSLSYFLSPELYLNGEGIGGSFLGEIIALDSNILFIIFTFILGMFINMFFINRKKSILSMGVYLIILPHIYYMSRDSFFPNIKYSFFCFLFVVIHYLIR